MQLRMALCASNCSSRSIISAIFTLSVIAVALTLNNQFTPNTSFNFAIFPKFVWYFTHHGRSKQVTSCMYCLNIRNICKQISGPNQPVLAPTMLWSSSRFPKHAHQVGHECHSTFHQMLPKPLLLQQVLHQKVLVNTHAKQHA